MNASCFGTHSANLNGQQAAWYTGKLARQVGDPLEIPWEGCDETQIKQVEEHPAPHIA